MNKIKKLMLSLSLLATTASGFAATPTMTWKIDTDKPLNDLTFGITMTAAAARNQFYYAYQFGFTGGGDIGYTGIQPTLNTPDGQRQFLVLFSSFRKDSVPKYKNCHSGADGSKNGVTCRLYIPGKPGDTFLFTVTKENHLLTGTVLNETSGRKDIIGQWTVGDTAGTLAGSQLAWIENYNMPALTCDKEGWPYYEVKFLPPSSKYGSIEGTISGLSRGSDACPGAITWTTDSTGTVVKGGYK